MNSDNRDFWSKPRNRWMILIVSAFSVFGGYVLASPGSWIQSVKQVSTSSDPIESKKSAADLPVSKIDSIALSDSNESTPLTFNEKAANAKATVKKTVDHLFRKSDSDRGTFDPFSREMSEREQIALKKEMKRGPEPYPYEISDEEDALMDKFLEGKLTPQEQARLTGFIISGYKPKKAAKDQNSDNSNKSAAENENNKQGKNASSSGGYYVSPSGASDKNSETDTPSDSNDEESNQFTQGKTSKSGQTPYSAQKSVPPGLEFTHENLEIYKFDVGSGAGLIPSILNWNSIDNEQISSKKGSRHYEKNLYSEIQKPMYAVLHRLYSIPADWDNHWFADDMKNGNELARNASNHHLLVLGRNGSVTFSIKDGILENQNGFDFIIWSNPFCYVNDEKRQKEIADGKEFKFDDYTPYNGRAAVTESGIACNKKLARVYVSETSEEGPWIPIEPCDRSSDNVRSRCAGYGVNLWKQNPMLTESGGDKYDLDDVSRASIKAIKIVDLGNGGDANRTGFALDAIALAHPPKIFEKKKKE